MDNRNNYRSISGTMGADVDYGRAQTVATATPAERGAFLRKVYLTLTGGIGVTMATGIALTLSALGNPDNFLWKVMQGNGIWMLFLAYLALSFGVGTLVHKRGINVAAYLFFTAFTGLFISPLLLMAVVKTQSLLVVWQALGLTVFTFGGLSGYVLVSGKDFAFMKGFLWTGFWILVGFMVVGFFVQSWAFHMGVTAAGLLVFAGFVLYHTSEIMHRMGPSDWVAGAFTLFIDFINMFIRVLMLLLGRRE